VTPEGWTELPVLDVCEKIGRIPTVPRSEYRERGQLPVVDQGQGLVAGFADYLLSSSAITPGSGSSITFPFAVGADGTQLLRAKPEHDQRFIFEALRALPLKNLGYARHFKLLRELTLLLPPIGEQKKRHGLNQAISREGVGVSTRAILDAFKNPLSITGQSGGRFVLTGRDAVVVVNAEGQLISTWATGSAGFRIVP